MHRTTTTATLLITVAVSALSGCTTVSGRPAPEPSAAPSLPASPPPGVRTGPQAVQAPAQEALERVGPPRQRERPAPAPDATASTTAAPPAAPPLRSRPEPRRPQRPEPRYPKQPRADIPGLSESARRNVTQQVPQHRPDVCALGRAFGGWRSDSPESKICNKTYGR
ncbi:hypothetical protein OQI_14910 [Streptomyces pharetrae CZA14]|uniref:Lipoprotein n=1 Tax=Streptomyces pharetrae CZA14 TaxID=1144883 RepID=A0ABX3YIM0_9ACTN|nr:hypothetical protein OQI_14910 [Streptomyces pharetrae CZA14]